MTLFLLFLLFCLSLCTNALSTNRCDYPLIGWIGCKCELDQNYLKILEKNLQEKLVGQDWAIQELLSAFRLHRFSENSNAPSSIHIAGDNGVGKTLTAKIIAESIFKRKSTKGLFPEGVLYVRGSTFNPDLVSKPLQKNKLQELIFSHLNSCDSPLVIIDEVEEMPRDMVGVFHSLLDDTIGVHEFGGKKVNAAKAMFIFLSDFGIEGFSKRKTIEQLKEIIHKESMDFWKDPKQTALIRHIIPYLPMNKDSATLFIKNRLLGLGTHQSFRQKEILILYTYNDKIGKAITDFFLQRSQELFYEYKNFRGLNQLFDEEIISELLFQAEEKTEYSLEISVDKQGLKFDLTKRRSWSNSDL